MNSETQPQQLDGSQLAILEAGARLTLDESTTGNHLQIHEEQDERLAEVPSESDSASVFWNSSFITILATNKHAANLLILWSFLDHNDLWYGLFREASHYELINEPLHHYLGDVIKDEASFNDAMHLISESFLVDHPHTLSRESHTMHSSVHRWLYLNYGIHNRQSLGLLALHVIGCAVPTSREQDYIKIQQRLLPHADVCSARLIYQGGLSLRDEDHSNDHLDPQISSVRYLSSVNNLGQLYADQGKLAEAEKMFLHILVGYEEVFDFEPQHIFILQAVHNLGLVYLAQNEFAKAEQMLLRVAKGYGEASKSYDEASRAGLILTLSASNSLGFLYFRQGELRQELHKFHEAEELLLQASEGFRTIFGVNHEVTLDATGRLGLVYLQQCRHVPDQVKSAMAEAMLLRVLDGYSTTVGPSGVKTHYPALLIMSYLGDFYFVDRPDKARDMFTEAREGFEENQHESFKANDYLKLRLEELESYVKSKHMAESSIRAISSQFPTEDQKEDMDAVYSFDSEVLADTKKTRIEESTSKIIEDIPIEHKVQELNRMRYIADQVSKLQPDTESVVRKRWILQISFTMDWYGDLLNNATEQLRVRGFEDEEILTWATIDSAFTITGTATNAIMMTCGEYLEEVWSERGANFKVLLKSTLCDPGEVQKGWISESTSIQMCLLNEQLVIDTSGELYVICEVAEMLGWLTAALYPTTSGHELEILLPAVSITESTEGTVQPDGAPRGFKCHMHVEREPISPSVPGQCWHAMFKGVRIVGGYPTKTRDSSMCGLELSLAAITQLLRTDSAITRSGFLSIRNFNHALVPAYHKENTIGWHYIYSNDGKRIPYWTAHPHEVEGLKVSELQQARHIIGWCSPASSMVGAPGDHYRIERSHLSHPPWKISLEGFTISISQYAGVSITGKFGVHSPALRIQHKEFVPKLLELRQEYVVLWNDGEQRGWLIDGLSALLHLVRASLYAKSVDPSSEDVFCLDLLKFEAPDGQYPEAAIKFFVKDKKIHENMNLEVFPGGYLVQDVVEHIYEVLSEAIDQQYQLAKQDGKQFAPKLGRDLTGWDFLEIAMEKKRCEPRSASFPLSSGPAWFELVRKINAPVLFGRNMGELIRPTGSDLLCSYWSTLPKEKYYLASLTSTVKNIIEYHGDGDTSSLATKLTDKLIWHRSVSILKECKCNDAAQGKHCDLAQKIGPNKLQKKSLEKLPPLPWNDNAAIVFS